MINPPLLSADPLFYLDCLLYKYSICHVFFAKHILVPIHKSFLYGIKFVIPSNSTVSGMILGSGYYLCNAYH